MNKHGDVVKRTTGQLPQLDIRRLQRYGMLGTQTSYYCNLTRYGSTMASVRIEVAEHRIILSYVHVKTGADGQSQRYDVPISVEWAPCHYGGKRAWFRCPESDCGRRIAILYCQGHFACRLCHRLAYYSQNSPPHHRALGRAQAIRERLGGTANMYQPFPDKPKGMHGRTYRRLLKEYREADLASWPGWVHRRVKRRAAGSGSG